MADIDIIAYLYPCMCTGGWNAATTAINCRANKGRHIKPLRHRPSLASPQPHSPESDDCSERAGTEVSDEHDNLDYLACLGLSLNDVPKSTLGLEAGWSSSADIILPQMPRVSRRHFYLTFNDNYCLIVKDVGTTAGTSVIYGGEDGGPRTNFEWIIAGDEFLRHRSPIIIKVTKHLQFQIVVKPFDRNSAAFKAKVDRFRAGRGGTGIDHDATIPPSTKARSEALETGEIFLRKKIGQGTFAVVDHLWNVSTGEQFALKVPVKGLTKSDIRKWKTEAHLLHRVSHDHIVKLLGWDDEPQPSLRFEYIPEGSIRDHLNKREYFSGIECRDILRQITSAVAHLHGLTPPITHRDISDNNILIERRGADGIIVKLADLGESKEGLKFNTIVGTRIFWPPELFGERVPMKSQTLEAYTKAVDIWELGAVIAMLAGGRPKYTDDHAADGTLWCKDNRRRVQRRYQEQRDDLDRLLLDGMLCMDPKRRWDAQRCHEESLRLSEGSWETWKTRAATTGRSPAKDEEDEADESSEDDREAKTMWRVENYHQNGEKHFFVRPDSEGVTAGLSDLVPLSSIADTTSLAASLRYQRSDAPGPEPSVQVMHAHAPVQEVLDAMNDPEDSLFLKSDIGGASIFSKDLRSASASETVTPRGVRPD